MTAKKLDFEDWLTIENIEVSYSLAFRDPPPPYSYECFNHQSFINYWSQVKEQATVQLITFLRQIKQFESLNEDDRVILIKCNLLPIGPVHKYLLSNLSNGSLWEPMDIRTDMCHQLLHLVDEDNTFRNTVISLFSSITRAIEHDLTLLRLLIAVLLFSKGLLVTDDEPLLNDPLAIYRVQSYYTRLIWNYLIDKYGALNAIKRFTQLLNLIFTIQLEAKYFRNYLHRHFHLSYVNFFSPLMKVLLHIS